MEESEHILITPETLSEIESEWFSELMTSDETSRSSKMADPQTSSTMESFMDPLIVDWQGRDFDEFSFGDMKDLAEDERNGSRAESAVFLSDAKFFGPDGKGWLQADDSKVDDVFETKIDSALDFDSDLATDDSTFLACDFLSSFLTDEYLYSDNNNFLSDSGDHFIEIQQDLSPPDSQKFQELGPVDGRDTSSQTPQPFLTDIEIFQDFYRALGWEEPAVNSFGFSPSGKSCASGVKLPSQQAETGENVKTISTLAFNPSNLAQSGKSVLKVNLREDLSNPRHPVNSVEGLVDENMCSETFSDRREDYALQEETMLDDETYDTHSNLSRSCVSVNDRYRSSCRPDNKPDLGLENKSVINTLPSSSFHFFDLSGSNESPRNSENCDSGDILPESGIGLGYSQTKSLSEDVSSMMMPNVFSSKPGGFLAEAHGRNVIFIKSVATMSGDLSCLDNGKGQNNCSPCDGLSRKQKSGIWSLSGTTGNQLKVDNLPIGKADDLFTYSGNVDYKSAEDISENTVDLNSDITISYSALETGETSIQTPSMEQDQVSDSSPFCHSKSSMKDQNQDVTHVLPLGCVKNIPGALPKPVECTCPCVNVGMKDKFVCLRVRDMWSMNVKDILSVAGHGDGTPKSENEIAKEKRAERGMLLKNKEQRLSHRK